MHKGIRIVVGLICLFGLVFIRFRESALFYDPLIEYYHGDYQNSPLPDLLIGKLFLYLIFRYALNYVLSMMLLWVIFIDKQILKFASLFYAAILVILLIVFYFLLQGYVPDSYLPLFYVRRFLIQPLLILLLVPAFFYGRKVNT